MRKIYVALLAPVIVGLLSVFVLQKAGYAIEFPAHIKAAMAPVIFILAAVSAVAGPIFYRSLFGHRQRNRTKVSRDDLYRYERNLTAMALVTPYLAMAGCFLQLPRFHLAATLLLALYAVYYYYPSRKRIGFDMKIFRVDH